MVVGQKIKALRLLKGLTQANLAIGLGMRATTHIARWEQSDSIPRTQMLQKLGRILEVNWPWLQDSSQSIINETEISFRPLSPYLINKPKWSALMTRDLAEIMPKLFSELKFETVRGFQAPCGGGIIVANNHNISMEIDCTPTLYLSLVPVLPTIQVQAITDLRFLKVIFLGDMDREICEQCGIRYVAKVNKPEPETSENFKTRIYVNASAEPELNPHDLEAELKKEINRIITKFGLLHSQVSVSVAIPKKKTTTFMDIIVDPEMKKLAKPLYDSKEF
jgi:transcriptional regulator with XRE-family HTH domain